MKEFCIEITPAQPLDKVEAKLKEMGYELGSRQTQNDKFAVTYTDGAYCTYSKYLKWDDVPLKTLDELNTDEK